MPEGQLVYLQSESRQKLLYVYSNISRLVLISVFFRWFINKPSEIRPLLICFVWVFSFYYYFFAWKLIFQSLKASISWTIMGFFWTKFMFIYSLYKYKIFIKFPGFCVIPCFFVSLNLQTSSTKCIYILIYSLYIVIKGEKSLNTCELIKSHLILQRGHLY